MAKKITFSFLCGLGILALSWLYHNYDFSFTIEDKFLKKVFLWKDKIYSSPPGNKADFVFINTGKDLALVDDTVDYGNVSVSDREKIYQLIHFIDSVPDQPVFTVIDIQFYYPYTIKPEIDSLLGNILANNERMLIPILKDGNDKYIPPLYKGKYAYSDYRTYGPNFNKFRILNHEAVSSIPIVMHESINKVKYKDHIWYATCNNRLCLSAVWPSYYLKNSDITGIRNVNNVQGVVVDRVVENESEKPFAKYYNIGEILFDLDANPGSYRDYFKDKIIFIGNFEQDQHTTPVGKMAGPVLLANIYLSLLNDQHIIGTTFIIFILLAFTGLSYIALYDKIPEVKFNFKFMFSSFLVKFIRGYISYFGCLFVLSILALVIFNVQLGLFLPSFILTGIEYVRHKKYLGGKPKMQEKEQNKIEVRAPVQS